ncbi:nitrate- and nitrite sensing domain-containing protein [Streptomyces sp. NPDC058665]|uniref:sensor histidine kinase n=1 Tax=Streptomyces sp. NPDC058665 TaxID=3346586 RepID=UPI00364E0530
MKINRRLVLLVTVPLVVAVTFAVLALAPATQQALQANRLTAMVDVASSVSELTHHLQRERASATALVSTQGDTDAFRKSSNATDKSVAKFRSQRDSLSSVPGNAQRALDRIDQFIEELPSLRAQVRSGGSTVTALTFGYRIVIADLIDYRDGIAQADGVDSDVADQIRAAAALSRASEHIGQQQVAVMRAQATGGFTQASKRTFDATRLGYTEATGVLFDLGPQQWRTWLERTLSGPKALEARRLEDEVSRTAADQELTVKPEEWQKASTDRLDLLRSVESRIDSSVLNTVTETRTALAWLAGGEVTLVLLTLISAVVVAVRLGRVMIRRLRDLRNAAHEVAHTGLPRVMTDLSQPGALSGATPEQVAERSGNPVKTTGLDEIGEVGEAFNAVHHEAVRLAAQQAHIHEQFAETLVGVARRGAQLTTVMVSELDAVQRDEADPERMKILFALDHLAIRMERNTNNLLVLGGYGHGRVRSADISCSTVIVAAAQQIERFDRVSLGVIESGIGIAARVVHDVAHILAELLDNATRFSPPDKQVGVAVWRLWDRAVVQIVDEGVGITAERRATLNKGLLEPKSGIGDVRSMGLHVVARLAARHGIVVELRDSSGPGTIAEVTLPANVLAPAPKETAPPVQGGPGERPGVQYEAPRPITAPGNVGRRKTAGAGDYSPAGAVAAGANGSQGSNGSTDPRGTGSSRSDAKGNPRGDERERANKPAQHPVHAEPVPRIAGVSSSGLPLRQRNTPQQWPKLGKRDGADQRSGAAPKPPRRRDSRQVSDVLAAYAQGINRSTSNRGRSATDDDTQRSKK